ncbi:MAG: PhzF family phenazine biosynthesis protein [Calditrichaeota bacterium]|nr:PhzF family phenazine biosynthesis protein [Calditrichota bacterium]
MNLKLYQIDAFANQVFAGNPAAVCPLTEWLDDRTLLAIARENNLSETAFFMPDGENYHLRWFTPKAEVDLCGHATLATAFVIFDILKLKKEKVTFRTKSGTLSVKKKDSLLLMNFPSREPVPCSAPDDLLRALEGKPVEILKSRDFLVLFENEKAIRRLSPKMGLLMNLDALGVIVTAPGENVDFVSRFFAPKVGVPEDPVTGSAHSTLIPYWAKKLGKTKLRAHQISERGGELFCEFHGERVKISGRAVKYLEGEIFF